MSANNKAILERANAAVAKGDHEGFLSHCTDKSPICALLAPGQPGPSIGGCRSWWAPGPMRPNLGPEHQGAKATGTERGRAIGDLWVQLEGTGETPGSSDPTTSVMTLGFDTAKRRFTGTWIGSMMTEQWLYDGELDAAHDRLTLTSEGPSMTDKGQTALYRDVVEFQGDDQRTLTAAMQQADGTWQPFMTVRYRRTRT